MIFFLCRPGRSCSHPQPLLDVSASGRESGGWKQEGDMNWMTTVLQKKILFATWFFENDLLRNIIPQFAFFGEGDKLDKKGDNSDFRGTMEPIELIHAGRFVSRGRGRHITRVIDSYELIFVHSGTLEMFEEGRTFSATAGSYLLLRPGLRHGGLAAYGPDLVFFWCHFLPRTPDRKARLEAMDSCRAARRPERLGEYFVLLLSELREVGSGNSADLLAELLLAEAERVSPGDEAQSCIASELAVRAREYIVLHFEESLSTAVLGEALHCNADYLNRVCRRSWGHTVTEEINLARLRYACRLLSQGNLSVKEIAFESGFNDPAYFRRRFRREFGLSPAEYRAAHSLGHVITA